MIKIIDMALLQDLSSKARANPRLRQNYNIHDSYEEPCQRLLNAMEPGSYIRPHRHLMDPKPESFIAVRGKFLLLIFTDNGEVVRKIPFGAGEETVGVDVPPGIWHTIISLREGSVFYEAKPGPFSPINRQDFAQWAPEEYSSEAEKSLKQWVSSHV